MLKGAQRRMIVVKTADSRIFEEAYFVIKTDTDSDELDMVAEAERIIDAALPKADRKRAGSVRRKEIVFGLCGMLGGIVLGSLGLFILLAVF